MSPFHYSVCLSTLSGDVGVTFKTEEERDSAILELVNIAGTHVMFENQGSNIYLNKKL